MGMPPMLGDEGIMSIDIGRPRSMDIGRASETCSSTASCVGWLPAYIATRSRFRAQVFAGRRLWLTSHSARSTERKMHAGTAQKPPTKNRTRPEQQIEACTLPRTRSSTAEEARGTSGMLTVTPWQRVADRLLLLLLEPESCGEGEPSFDAAPPPPSFPHRCSSFANSCCLQASRPASGRGQAATHHETKFA